MTVPGHIRGSSPILFTKHGGYEVELDGAAIVLRNRAVFVDGSRLWRLGASRRRAWIGETRKQKLASAARGPSGWEIDDDLSTVTLALRRREEHMSGRFESLRSRRRDGTISTGTGASAREIGSVSIAYSRLKGASQGGRTPYSGWLKGSITASEGLSLPVAVLALRISLGRWAWMPPRTGEWTVNDRQGIG